MRKEVFMAGAGGQGVLLIGQLLTQAAMDDGLEVSWFPIYSPEVRGGTTSCTVVVSDGSVGSPISGNPASMMLMDQFSVDTHAGRARSGGLVVVNSTLVKHVDREDLELAAFPGTEKAAELGDMRVANMVMVGCYAELTGMVAQETLRQALETVIPERHHNFLPLNRECLAAGAEMAREFARRR